MTARRGHVFAAPCPYRGCRYEALAGPKDPTDEPDPPAALPILAATLAEHMITYHRPPRFWERALSTEVKGILAVAGETVLENELKIMDAVDELRAMPETPEPRR